VAVDEGLNFVVSEGDIGVGDGDVNMGNEEDMDEMDPQDAINAACVDVWSGLHYDDNDAEEYVDDGEGEVVDDSDGEGEVVEGADGEGEDMYDDWDDDKNRNGLSPLDMLGEDFERYSVANGEQMCANVTYISTYNI